MQGGFSSGNYGCSGSIENFVNGLHEKGIVSIELNIRGSKSMVRAVKNMVRAVNNCVR